MAKAPRKRALVGNASDPEQTKRAGNVTRARAERERNNLNAVLSTREGRAEFWRLLAVCGLLESTFNQNASVAAYLEGRRSVATQYLQEVTGLFPELYLLAQQEAIEDDQLTQSAKTVTESIPDPSDEPAP